MKLLSRILTVLLLVVMVCTLLPNLNTPASAASTPVLVLDSSTASASILDHKLDFDTYSTGGPFTATFEWKCNLSQLSATEPNYYASVQSIGTFYGSMVEQPDPQIYITNKTNWTKVSYTFENVGTYPMVGSNLPGNIFRFRIHDAKGQLYVRNLVIKNAAGTVLYSLNNDSVVSQLIGEMEASGLTQADMSELARINFDNCPWMANQFDSGKYTSYVLLETAEPTTTSSITRPTTVPTTQPTTAPTTTPTTAPTTAPTTKPTTAPTTKTTKPTTATTTRPTTVPTTEPTTVPTTEPTTVPTTEPTTVPTTVPTTAPTTAPTVPNNPGTQNNSGVSPTFMVIFIVMDVILVGTIAMLLIILVKKKG